MLKKLCFYCLFIFSFLILSNSAYAISDPLAVPNNRFGIHILNEADLQGAADLVNSQGGQWGYVTLVIQQNDLDTQKWQKIFDELRDLKLIPLVRLATQPAGDYWQIPQEDSVDRWVDFFASLNWVIQNRYVILFNEPNHSSEWGNRVDPQQYAQIVELFTQKLKHSSNDYFILPAGFDTAAPNSQSTMAATDYWQQMFAFNPHVFTLFDGWNSHSYPNPNFSGPLTGTGFGSLKSYRQEINYLSRYNLPVNLPVFITETGWIRQDEKILGATTDSQALSRLYTQAFADVWQDKNLVAVTPFILNYPQQPFSQFSWKKDDNTYYPHYYAVKALAKTAGQPRQLNQAVILSHNLPAELIDNSDYQFFIEYQNTGQSVWNRQDFSLQVTTDNQAISVFVNYLEDVKPFGIDTVSFNLKTNDQHTGVNLQLQLYYQNEPFGPLLTHSFKIIPPPSLIVKAQRLFKLNQNTDSQLLIYDQQQTLKKQLPISLTDGLSAPIKLYSLVPDQIYRFVLLSPFYLPRQTIAQLGSDSTQISFKPLIPLDLDQNGHFNFHDLIFGTLHPLIVFRLFRFW